MKSTNLFILYISSFAIIIGSLIVYFIAKHFSKPIEDMDKVAVNISKLDFCLCSRDTYRKDELGRLAVNINHMADSLEENIVNLKEANRKLEIDNRYMSEVDEQRKELIANISHELKTPLSILTGYTEMLSNDIPGIDKAFYYETIQDESRKMDILIKKLLHLSDFESRLLNLSREEIQPEVFTKRIYRKNSLLMNQNEILHEFYAETCGKVTADPMYLEIAISNYLSNAISYTAKGHKIIVKVEQVEEKAVISVFNEGSKILEENKKRRFGTVFAEKINRGKEPHRIISAWDFISFVPS